MLSYHLKIFLNLQASQDGSDFFSESTTLQLAPYGNYYQNLGGDESLRRTYELLACFKKDMHKVRNKNLWVMMLMLMTI